MEEKKKEKERKQPGRSAIEMERRHGGSNCEKKKLRRDRGGNGKWKNNWRKRGTEEKKEERCRNAYPRNQNTTRQELIM